MSIAWFAFDDRNNRIGHVRGPVSAEDVGVSAGKRADTKVSSQAISAVHDMIAEKGTQYSPILTMNDTRTLLDFAEAEL